MLKHLPQSERLLQGKLNADLSIVATEANVDTPPSSDKLPTYIEFEPDSDQVELCRVIGVSGNIITLERGLNNGGVGIAHLTNAAYEQKFTSRHYQAVVDALESGFLTEDESYSFAKVDADTLTITGADLTSDYAVGRIVRLNGSNICVVLSSSYATDVTTVNLSEGTIPTTITSIEIAIQPKGKLDTVYESTPQTLLNKRLDSPKIGTAICDTNGNEIIKTPATASAVNEFTDTNAATGNAPERSVTGDDTNIDHKLKGKGTGVIKAYDPTLADYVPITDSVRYSSMFRQAIINGNFDVWQRGTSFAIPGTARSYTADRWATFRAAYATGATISRQTASQNGSLYSCRVQRDSGNSGTGGIHLYNQIETVNAPLLRGQKLTLSFYAKCGANYSSASSLLTTNIRTGTGSDENFADSNFTGGADNSTTHTLTTSFTKFTFTMSAAIGATVNEIALDFNYTPVGTASTNDWFEIAQVQLCAGDVALPFTPKSYEEEQHACDRYCQVFTGGGSNFAVAAGSCTSTTNLYALLNLRRQMRSTPAITATAADWSVSDGVTITAITAIAIVAARSSPDKVMLSADVGSGLTQYRAAWIEGESAAKLMILSSEL